MIRWGIHKKEAGAIRPLFIFLLFNTDKLLSVILTSIARKDLGLLTEIPRQKKARNDSWGRLKFILRYFAKYDTTSVIPNPAGVIAQHPIED